MHDKLITQIPWKLKMFMIAWMVCDFYNRRVDTRLKTKNFSEFWDKIIGLPHREATSFKKDRHFSNPAFIIVMPKKSCIAMPSVAKFCNTAAAKASKVHMFN